MPGEEVEDGIHNLFELDNSSQGQHFSHAVNGNWSVLNDNLWVGKQRLSVAPLNFNLKNYGVQKLVQSGNVLPSILKWAESYLSYRETVVVHYSVRGRSSESVSVPYKPNYTKLTPIPENNRSHSRNYQLNTNGSFLGNQGFQTGQNQPVFNDQHNLILRGLSIVKSQQEYESGTDSPTLTANSERSEITEVSTDLNFLRGQQQLAKDHQPGTVQPVPMQQPGFSDMQLLQQHMMFKQLQELQRQQQLQQLGDVRQQNPLNQLPAISKQVAGGQFSPLNGTPINDASQMFMNWVQSGASSGTQGVANRLMFSAEQGQSLRSMGLVSQPVEGSLYGTPVATAKGNMGQYSHIQGIPQAQKPTVQSSGFSNSFLRDQFTVSPDQASMTQGAFMSNQGFSGKNMFGQVPNPGLNSGILSGNLQEANSPQSNSSMKELNGRQEQTVWPAMQQKTTQHGPNQGLVPLDPMEEKILYNMDENIWDASFGRHSDMGTAGFGNMMENTDLSNSFPSLQSGSWSALMQSAVAEASSSDTGMQEEWSGLTFQNTEQSTDNQLSNFMEGDNQQTGWVDNNLPSASSFTSKPLHMFNDSNMSSSFPGFQHQGIQFSGEQREGLRQNGESMEKSPKVTGEWVDCNPQQKPSVEGSQQVQSFMHLNNAWAGQINERSEGDMQQQRMASHINLSVVPNTVKSHQATSQQILQNNQSDYMRHADISIAKREKESMGKGPHVYSHSYDGEAETYEKQKSYYPRENSNGSFNSKGLSRSEQGHASQFQFLGNVSSNAMGLEQVNISLAHLAHVQGNSRASEELPSGGDLRSLGSGGSNIAAQARLNHESQNMLELLNKVDQSREDGTTTHFGSADGNSMTKVPENEVHTSGAQLYNLSSTSQGFGLRLGPPSQRLTNSSHLLSAHSSPQAISYQNLRQANSDLKEKNQPWVASPSSFQTFPPTHELSPRAHWEDKASASGQTGTSSYLTMQGNSNAAYASSPSYMRNQPQTQFMSSAAVSSQASQATLANTTSRYQLLNRVASHDTPRQIYTNPLGQQFPVLEALPVSQPSVMTGMSQQGESSARPHNVWTNVTIQRQPPVPSSMDPSNNSMISSPKGEYGSPEFGASEQQISSETLDASQAAGSLHGLKPSPKHVSDSNALLSGSLLVRSNQQAFDREKNEDSHALTASEGNLVSVGQSLESSPQIPQKYSLMGQLQAVKNIENDPSRRVGQYEYNPKFGNLVDSGQGAGVQPNSFPSRDTNMLSLQDRPSTEMAKLGQSDSQNQPGSNVASNLTEHSQVNLRMAPSWFNKYGTLQNGQMLPPYDARLAKMAAGQLSLVKPPHNMHIQASVQRVDATDASQGGTVIPSAHATLVGADHSLGPSVLPSDIANQSMAITRPKKRKIVTPEVLPWHKEVTQGSQRLQNMSMAEEHWAQATNRLIEKIQDEVDILEDVPPVFRSKRRLVLTTQLMQQLLRPAPESILSADVASHYDSVIYSVSRLALGDACSLTYYPRNDLLEFMDDSSMISEKLDTSEGTFDQQFSEVVEKLTARVKKLENDFQRVEKAASIVDIRVECQELERFAVINRFAKFHIRGQADISGTSLSSVTPKPFPQRYVTALPMPRKLPEGLQCVSL
ncbi:hypothetical protein Patl1_21721 [Pistacia atlantica]|uniref:Uncharacterized protein n=1 Tax=Pistacia atlantica TaxID=434234 RepID=A0ACC1BLQ5_9ROSI|nr:hypothetical protein Patl1_21721 [Pistacia atlantica]